MSYDPNSLIERVARIIDPKAHAELDADFAKTKSITWEKMYAMPGVKLSREKAEQVIAAVHADPSSQPQMVGEKELSTLPDLPEKVWIDARDMSIHLSAGDGLLPYHIVPDPKRHKHYKTDKDIARMRELADQGLSQKEIAKKLGVQARTVRKFVGHVYGKYNTKASSTDVRDILEGM